jgi:glycosyltransferase involved in cell wall biosynthesis
MIIWLASYPRSGNTYFRILLKHFYGISTYSLYRDDEFTENPDVQELVGPLPKHKSLAMMAQAKDLYFVKTHELPQDDSSAIYLVRDGRDVLLSYAWYILTNENPGTDLQSALFWKTLHTLIIDSGYFGGWGTHVLAWTKRQTSTAIVKFEDFVRSSNPLNPVKQALNSLGYKPPEEVTTIQPPTFSTLHQIMPQFFRKGQIDSWQDEMSPKLHELFWQRHGDAMREMGYVSAAYNNQFTPIKQRIIFEEKKKRITKLSDKAEQRLQLLCQYENEVTIMEKLIRTQQREIAIKEKAIQYLKAHPLRTLLRRYLPPGAQDGIRQVYQWFQPKIEQFHQYAPIQLKIPTHYYHTTVSSQQSLPVVSIVTPSLNQAQFLEKTIKSVTGQNYSKLQYILQDGASTDETSRILEKYQERLSHVESCQDRGQADAINLGFRHAGGDIMAWLNADDLLLPGTIPYVVNFFLEHPEVDAIYGHRIMIDEEDQEIGRGILPPHDDKMLLWADYVPQETLFWRRRIWEKAGASVDESYHFALDWVLLLRFRAAGAIFVRVPRFLAAFRIHPQQKTSSILGELGQQEMSRLRKQLHKRHVSTREIRHHLRSYWLKHLVYDRLYWWGALRY